MICFIVFESITKAKSTISEGYKSCLNLDKIKRLLESDE